MAVDVSSAPAPASPQPSATAPLAKGAVPDPHANPVEYLLSKGWKPLGFPNQQGCLWLDTSKPLRDTWTTEPIMIQVERDKPDGRPGEKHLVTEQLHYHTGIRPNGQRETKPRVRSVCTPAVKPIPMPEAISICMQLDWIAQEKVLEEAKKTKKAA